MAGRINDIDLMVIPVTGNGRRGNGDTPLTFLGHPVGDCCPFVHLTDFVRETRIVQDSFAHCGLAAINMSDDADIRVFSNMVDICFSRLGALLREGLRSSTQKCNVRLEEGSVLRPDLCW